MSESASLWQALCAKGAATASELCNQYAKQVGAGKEGAPPPAAVREPKGEGSGAALASFAKRSG
jgi:hypothetical protein